MRKHTGRVWQRHIDGLRSLVGRSGTFSLTEDSETLPALYPIRGQLVMFDSAGLAEVDCFLTFRLADGRSERVRLDHLYELEGFTA